MKNYLKPTAFIDFEHKNIQNLVTEFKTTTITDKEKAILIYTKVRDLLRYNAFDVGMMDKDYTASEIAVKSSGQCISKSIVLTACYRAIGIPARLHYARVKNHIAVESFLEKLGSNEIAPHGMVDVFLNNKWIEVSPAFDSKTCEKFNVNPLEFDGENNSLMQKFNNEGNQFMEYTKDLGHYDDVPLDFLFQTFIDTYPTLFDKIFDPSNDPE
jgi:transglutaminase-like putative cysteine protease